MLETQLPSFLLSAFVLCLSLSLSRDHARDLTADYKEVPAQRYTTILYHYITMLLHCLQLKELIAETTGRSSHGKTLPPNGPSQWIQHDPVHDPPCFRRPSVLIRYLSLTLLVSVSEIQGRYKLATSPQWIHDRVGRYTEESIPCTIYRTRNQRNDPGARLRE